MESLEDRAGQIEGLIDICNKRNHIYLRTDSVQVETGYDMLEYEDVDVYDDSYVHSKNERKAALKKLREYKEEKLDEEIRNKINQTLKRVKKESRDNIAGTIAATISVGLVGLMFAGVGLGIKSCVSNELQRRDRIARIIPDYSSVRYLENVKRISREEITRMKIANKRFGYNFYEKDIELQQKKIQECDEKIIKFEEKMRDKVGEKYLTPEHESWKTYEDIYGDRDWWPKNQK